MITYDPLWETLRRKNISQYKLLNEYNFSHGTLSALKQNKSVTIATINSLMNLLELDDISEVMRYIPEK